MYVYSNSAPASAISLLICPLVCERLDLYFITMSCRVIIVGDVNGQLQQVFSKLRDLHAKNNFDFAIIAGNLFSDDPKSINDLISGNIIIPLCTYFTVGDIPLPELIISKIRENEEIVPNLHFLEKRSIVKTSEGVRIATLSGKLDKNSSDDKSNDLYSPFHTIGDAKVLYGTNTVDILLTTLWPASIRNHSKVQLVENLISPAGYEHISALCSHLKPRYHFSVTPSLFFEREPFFHQSDLEQLDSRAVTRFISLSALGVPKQKSLYAFTLSLVADPRLPLPIGTTVSPWTFEQKLNKREAIDLEPFLNNRPNNKNKRKSKREQYPNQKGLKYFRLSPDECFFCLSNPNLETHLVSSVGEDAYMTIAKGPLTTSKINVQYDIDFPAHLLIIPLAHSPTLASIPEEDNMREKTFMEMVQYRKALQDMISRVSRNKLGAVTYEISRSKGVHTHWQFVPVPETFISKGLVEASFKLEAEKLSYPAFEVRDPVLNLSDENFFRIWIWTPPNEENPQGHTNCLTMSIYEDLRFSLQFGRIVLAKLLGIEDRIQWRDCMQSKEAERIDNEKFKAAFKEFDFTQ
ncbi:CWF19-like protein mug161 [Erysiphe neolycopersici]|uniref:CWF19-like protein mug161 n=1 Tax=Erysiphe neolycopersici TaxID=212602 RepID=A0A420I1A2_9PEZI|nr:CWF19-like protein mug161 [Erysiphe neolycopersici]